MKLQADMADVPRHVLAPVLPAIERAIVRRNDLLIAGPPGIAKTMIARRIPSIMPALPATQARILTLEYQIAGILAGSGEIAPDAPRPFRAPHHSVSDKGLAGEAILASYGVLFLDELPEFRIPSLKALASQLREMGSRHPLIVASSINCPCGWRGSVRRRCVCTSGALARFTGRLVRMVLEVGIVESVQLGEVDLADLRANEKAESSADIRARIEALL